MSEINEPELTTIIQQMERQGLDPMHFIEFVGEVAVWRGNETDNEL